MSRPTKSKQVDIQKTLLEHFEQNHSAIYTAKLTGLNRNTVSGYFRTFADKLIEEVDQNFIVRQKVRKELVLVQLEEDLAELDRQLEELKILTNGIENTNSAMHSIRLNIITSRAALRQQIADIDMTPTLDVSLEILVEEALSHETESGSHQPPKGK